MVSSSAFSQWTRTSGPEGISISSLVNIDGTIYAGTGVDGLYTSTDDGINWIPLNAGIETQEVTSVVSQPGYLFAGTFGGGVYRSTDGGQTWMAPLTGGNLAITAMVVNDPYIFAGTVDEGVYRSSDNGATWIQKLPGFTSIQAMCTSGNTVFASTYGYTYGSTDNGENWYHVSALEGAAPWSFYCDHSLILAGGVNKIYKSTDYGNTFITIELNFPFSIVNIYSVTAIGSTVFAATSYDGVYNSTDNGLTWSPANEGMGPKDTRALAVSGTSTLIAGTHYVGVYRSTDMGSHWNKSMAGFTAGSTIATMLSSGSSIFAGTRGDGMYRTTDNGASWMKLSGTNDTLNYSAIQEMCEKDGVIYAGTRLQFSSTVYKSTDNGLTWTRSGSGLPSNLTFVTDMATSGNNIISSTDEGVYYSPDDGANWYQANIPNQHIPSIAIGGGYVYAADPGTGIYRSANNGVDWSLVLQSSVDYIEVAAIDNYAFAGSFFSGARYSSNNGNSWFASAGFPPDASVFALGPAGNGMVLAGTDLKPSWIYASFDNGISFSPYSEGLGQRAPVEAFAVNDSFMFAGTDDNGVWRRLRPGAVSIQTQPEVAQTFHLAQNFPNPFNPITTIKFGLAESQNIVIKIYNALGEEVKTLISDYRPAGEYQVSWDGTNNSNLPVASGVYLYRIETKNFTETRRMILIR
jgi:photosystem II stability/assembly factor-like uncharacterized protein